MKKDRIVIIAGPTGVGKTASSIKMARDLDGEIVSADSMQIYQGMDIGTAKIRREEMEGIPHHMLDIVSPFENFTVAQYADLAKQKIQEIISRGKMPILVGGTGLYINAILYQMDFNEAKVDETYRSELWAFYEKEGEDALFERLLSKLDGQEIKIEKQNIKRVIRALEIIKARGSYRDFQDIEPETNYDHKLYILNRDRKLLYERINLRVDLMFEEGLLDEVKALREMGLDSSHQSMKGIGYRQVLEYLDGQVSLEEAKEKIKQESRRYAKRQITWFKRYKEGIWLDLIV